MAAEYMHKNSCHKVAKEKSRWAHRLESHNVIMQNRAFMVDSTNRQNELFSCIKICSEATLYTIPKLLNSNVMCTVFTHQAAIEQAGTPRLCHANCTALLHHLAWDKPPQPEVATLLGIGCLARPPFLPSD